MSLRADLCAYLETKTAVTDLIGTRIYPQIAKGNVTLPYVIYSRAGVDRKAISTGASGTVFTTVRLTSFANTYDAACDLADQLRIVLDGKSGTIGDASYFDKCRLIAESDNIDPVEFAQNDAPHFVSQDYQITHTESIPTL